jgi:hypothetical protein
MVISPMVGSKYPFLLCSRPQTPDSPPRPTFFSSTFCLRCVSSWRPYFVTSSSATQDRPQPLSAQSLAHTFRHIGGVPPTTSISEFRFSSFTASTISGSSLPVTLATRVKHKSFISNVYKKHRGWGTVDCQSRALLIPHAFGYTHKLPQFLSSHGFIS